MMLLFNADANIYIILSIFCPFVFLILFLDGMTAFFNVTQCFRDTYFETPKGRTKKYFIAAEEITWNYMTEGKDLFSASDMSVDHGFSRYVK